MSYKSSLFIGNKIDIDFWRGKRVLVTGHTGFKGSWLCVWLHQLGAQVFGYALAPSDGANLFETADVAAILEQHIVADIRDAALVAAAMTNFQPEIIFHLAAQPLVLASYDDPVTTYAVNVIGALNVLEAARRLSSVRAIIVVTSDKCYDPPVPTGGYRENDRLGGHDPYSSSKACVELAAQSWRRSFLSQANPPCGLATVRAGNVVGGGDWSANRLVPDLIRGFIAKRPTEIRNRDAVRPWQHVLDPLSGYMLTAEALLQNAECFADAWNFGPPADSAWPVSRVADYLGDLWGGDVGWTDVGRAMQPTQKREEIALTLDSAKARIRLNWAPQHDTATALALTVAWHKEHLAGGNMQKTILNQINDHQQTASNC